MTDSIYDQLNVSGTVAKQRVVETFSGDALDTDRWTQRNITGTGTFNMDDTSESNRGGVRILTGASTDSKIAIDFNSIRQYSHDGSVFIAVCRRSDSSTRVSYGLTNTTGRTFNFADHVDSTANTYKSLRTADGSTISETQGTDTVDETMATIKLVLSSSNIIMSKNNVTDVTKTTNRPTVRLMPSFEALTLDGSANGGNLRYLEVYNT